LKKRVVILGAGESGTGSAILAAARGYDVFVSDSGEIKDRYRQELRDGNIAFEEGKHSNSVISKADIIIKSPGIPDQSEIVVKARESGIEVISEIEFAGRFSDATMICISGSNGKTTTTQLIYKILSDAGLKAGLAGNVGQSFARQVAEASHDY